MFNIFEVGFGMLRLKMVLVQLLKVTVQQFNFESFLEHVLFTVTSSNASHQKHLLTFFPSLLLFTRSFRKHIFLGTQTQNLRKFQRKIPQK